MGMDTYSVKFQLALTPEQVVLLRRVMDAEQQAFPKRGAQTEKQSLQFYIRRHVTDRIDKILNGTERYYRVLSGEEEEETQ